MTQSAASSGSATVRKGATRAADIPPDVLASLSRGESSALTLTETLAVDQRILARSVFPGLAPDVLKAVDAAADLGILKRMQGVAQALLQALGDGGVAQCEAHTSDTVRGWACFMIGAMPADDLGERLRRIRGLADDAHFGVREWAWMAVRPHLTERLDDAVALLAGWTGESSEYLRRFASESIRPRGVWCAHIAALKKNPDMALPVLSPLKADPSTYVQDSVANWLNDAGKDQPAWVRALCASWQKESPVPATGRICQRALRNLKD
ncbi:MAG: DNA alkylation repair protein [Lautropia sp.]|nr:DNA alkylation repair protein [Lautropia sp.]